MRQKRADEKRVADLSERMRLGKINIMFKILVALLYFYYFLHFTLK